MLLTTYSERERRERPPRQGRPVRRTRTAARPGWAAWPACRTRPSWTQKQADETKLRAAVAADPKLRRRCGDAWDDVAASARRLGRDLSRTTTLLERGAAFNSELFGIARTLVRLAEETAKPNAERLREYRESNLESLKQQLFSEAPIYDDLEIVKLADSLSMFVELAGARRPAGAEGAGRQVAAGAGRRAGRAARSWPTSAVRKQAGRGRRWRPSRRRTIR